MDAQAYLLRHGWSGPGNPLNPNRRPGTHGGLGLTRPILVARRQGNQGVGKKTTKDHTNQWWLRGFEDALKGVGEENRSGAGETKRAPNALTSELYRFFVRGETVPGTLGGVEKKAEEEKEGAKKRKAEEGDEMEIDGEGKKRKKGGEEEKKETKEERRVRREEKRRRKEERAKRKEERRKRREAKEVRRAERREKKEKKRLLKEAKKQKKDEEHRPEEEYPTPPATELEQTESSGRDESVVQEVKKAKKEKKEKKEKSKKREASTSDAGSKKKSKKSESG